MKYAVDSLPPAERAQAARVRPGRGLLLSSAVPCQLRIESTCAERFARTLELLTGQRLLVMAAGTELLLSGGELLCANVPEVVPRLLAFHDHAAGVVRPAPSPVQAMVQALAAGPAAEDACRNWLLAELVSPGEGFAQWAALWARGEAYQLVRFVLANSQLCVQQLAARYGLSPAQFRRVCLRIFGRPLKEQLRLIRASRALRLHADTGASFTDVAIETGFASPSHFCCEIKSLLGKPPRAIFGLPRRP